MKKTKWIYDTDPYLKPFQAAIEARHKRILEAYAGILSPPPPGHSMNNLYNSPWLRNIESSLSSQLPFPAGLSSYADVRLQLLNSPVR